MFFTWYIDLNFITDKRILELLRKYRIKESGTINEYYVSEAVYQAMRSLIQGALTPTGFSWLFNDAQAIVLYPNKHFRINKSDENIFELALGYAEIEGIDKEAVSGKLKPHVFKNA